MPERCSTLGYQRLIHSDWSVDARKRWKAVAVREGGGWRVAAPEPAGDLAAFVDALFAFPNPVLAGFDMPIGLPDAFGQAAGVAGFRELLPLLGRSPPWCEFFLPNDRADTITPARPFFPARPFAGMRALALTERLHVADLDALRRRCERAHAGRRAATPLFWTVGPAQVGKAAISGWRDVLQPGIARGARLWPFDGALNRLIHTGAPVLCETYPGEAYRHLDVRFGPRMSKRRQEDRQAAASGLAARCATHGILLDEACRSAIADGFGRRASGEDAFDALIGLLGMIEVVDGRRAAMPRAASALPWEGWILGQDGATGVAMDGTGR